MSDVDWSQAPEGAERCNVRVGYRWLRKGGDGNICYFKDGLWLPYSSRQKGFEHWLHATSRPSRFDVDAHVSDATKVKRSELPDAAERQFTWPDGAERYVKELDVWLENKNGVIWYTRQSDGKRYKGSDQKLALAHWDLAIERPDHSPLNTVNTTITQRGKRYGKFKDGAVIMQDLTNVMRETPNWEGLTPSQREALEMIQHKIGRILNGDPMYDDNWRGICGYSQLILDELNA